MFIDQNGSIYSGDMKPEDREATAEEVAAWEAGRQPSPLLQIRAIESPNDDNRKKLTRQFMIASAFKEAKEQAKANPATASWTDAQIQAYLMAQGKGYAQLWLEEQQIIPLRAQL